MAAREMTTQRLSAPPAIHANHMISAYRSPHRNGRGPLGGRFCLRFPEPNELRMYVRDQSAQLVGRDFVAPQKRGDDFRRVRSLDRCGRRLTIRHLEVPQNFWPQYTHHPNQFQAVIKDSPYRFGTPTTILLRLRPAKKTPPASPSQEVLRKYWSLAKVQIFVNQCKVIA
jgi:hypothetical protein